MKLLPVLLLCFLLEPSSPARILLYPMNHGSHMMYFVQLARRLVENGHEVTLLYGSGFKRSVGMDSPGIEFKTFKMKSNCVVEDVALAKEIMSTFQGKGILSTMMDKNAQKIFRALKDEARELFDDEETMSYIYDRNFEFVVTEPFGEYLLLAYHLGVPYSVMSIDFPNAYSRRPFFTSQEVGFLYVIRYPKTFLDRTMNAMSVYLGLALGKLNLAQNNEYIHERFPNIPETLTYLDILKNATFTLALRLPVVTPPKSSMPTVFDVGGLMARPANLSVLSPELQQFADTAKSGFILVSFGSTFDQISPVILQKLMDAFEKLDFPVLLKRRGALDMKVPSNVKISSWIPQNDLLGHPNIKAFVTHCGFSGLVEALNQGVPIVGFPLSVDQNGNCANMEDVGIIVDVTDFGPDDVIDAVRKITEKGNQYGKNMKKVSSIMRDLPDPGKTLSFWIDHVIKHGRGHLRSPAFELEDYEFLGLDIMLVAFVCVFCLFGLCTKCWCFVCKRMCKVFRKQKRD